MDIWSINAPRLESALERVDEELPSVWECAALERSILLELCRAAPARPARLPCRIFSPESLPELYEDRRLALTQGIIAPSVGQVALTVRLLSAPPSPEELARWLEEAAPAGLWLWFLRPGLLTFEAPRIRVFIGDAGLNRLAAQLWELDAFRRPLTRWGEQVEQLGALFQLQRICDELAAAPLKPEDLPEVFPRLQSLGQRLELPRLRELVESGERLLHRSDKRALLLRLCQRATQICQDAHAQALLEQHRQRLLSSHLRAFVLFDDEPELELLVSRCEANGIEIQRPYTPSAFHGVSWEAFDICIVSEHFHGLDGIELALTLDCPCPLLLIAEERTPFTLLRASHAGFAGVAAQRAPLAELLNELTLAARQPVAPRGAGLADADPLLEPITRALRAATIRGEALGMLLLSCQESEQDALLITCQQEMGPLVTCCRSESDEVALFWPGVDEAEVRSFITRLRARFRALIAAGLFCAGQRAPGPLLRELRQRLRWSLTAGEHLVMGWWRTREGNAMVAAESQRILIVDQDEDTRELIRFACERLGFSVATLGSGSEALALIERGELPLQLLIAEISLPQVGGLELLRAIRRRSAHQIAVLLLSLSPDQSWIEEGFQLGANDFVYKPFNLAELLARIRHVLAQQQLVNRTPTPTPAPPQQLLLTEENPALNEQRLRSQRLHSPIPFNRP